MRTSMKATGAAFLSVVIVLAGSASALAFGEKAKAQTLPAITETGAVQPPMGMAIFCLLNMQHCQSGGDEQVPLSTALLQVLRGVNTRVNLAITPRDDPDGDVWSINVSAGDCEDFVLTKRGQLIALGLPASALRIATALTPTGIGHAVLMVRTSHGDLVLDNRTPAIRPWQQTDLQWVAMSGANPNSWHAVQG